MYMIRINYQMFGTRGFRLRLRLFQDGKTRYIVVNRLLSGNLQRKHWNPKKQMFYPSAPYSEENNDILARFKSKYDKKALDWVGSLDSMLLEMENEAHKPDGHKFVDILNYVISELKKDIREDGTIKGTFEVYEKVGRKMKLFCDFSGFDYENLVMEDFTPEFINRLFDWIQFKNNNKGIVYVSQMIHALLVRCERMGFFDMKTVEFCRWAKKKSPVPTSTTP